MWDACAAFLFAVGLFGIGIGMAVYGGTTSALQRAVVSSLAGGAAVILLMVAMMLGLWISGECVGLWDQNYPERGRVWSCNGPDDMPIFYSHCGWWSPGLHDCCYEGCTTEPGSGRPRVAPTKPSRHRNRTKPRHHQG